VFVSSSGEGASSRVEADGGAGAISRLAARAVTARMGTGFSSTGASSADLSALRALTSDPAPFRSLGGTTLLFGAGNTRGRACGGIACGATPGLVCGPAL